MMKIAIKISMFVVIATGCATQRDPNRVDLLLPATAYYKVQGAEPINEKLMDRLSQVRQNILELSRKNKIQVQTYNFCRVWAWYDFAIELANESSHSDSASQAADEVERFTQKLEKEGLAYKVPHDEVILFSDFKVANRGLWLEIEAKSKKISAIDCGPCHKAQAEVELYRGGYLEKNSRFRRSELAFSRAEELIKMIDDQAAKCPVTQSRIPKPEAISQNEPQKETQKETQKVELREPTSNPVPEKPNEAVLKLKELKTPQHSNEFRVYFAGQGSKTKNILNVKGLKDWEQNIAGKLDHIDVFTGTPNATNSVRTVNMVKYLTERFPGLKVNLIEKNEAHPSRCMASENDCLLEKNSVVLSLIRKP